MTKAWFPDRIRALEPYEGRFQAHRLPADGCEVLFASYPAGAEIAPHSHETENHGIITAGELILIADGVERRFGPGDWYTLPANTEHAARFEADTAEIEFWFTAAISR